MYFIYESKKEQNKEEQNKKEQNKEEQKTERRYFYTFKPELFKCESRNKGIVKICQRALSLEH